MKSKEFGFLGVVFLVGQAAANFYSNDSLLSELETIRKELHSGVAKAELFSKRVSELEEQVKVLQKQAKLRSEIEKDLSEIMECDPIIN